MGDPARCLEPHELSAWVDGAMTDADVAGAIAHVAGCAACREAASMLAAMATEGARDDGGADLRERVGRYEIERVIGRGGMGRVVAARDPVLDRRVALKLIASSGGDDEGSLDARLVREARALARVRHPNVVAIHEAGAADGFVFIAMELMEGGSLRAYCGGSRPWRDAVSICLDAGRGLEALHAAGLVHRDVKPDNILIGADGRGLIADLGLARRIAGEESAPLTRTGAVVGTPAYMAPEQLAGGAIDARTDQYGFSATVWEVCFGVRFPAEGDGRSVPPRVRAVLARGLASAPSARFSSLGALLGALEAAAGPRRGRRALAVAAGVVVIAGAAALAFGLATGVGGSERDPGATSAATSADADARVTIVVAAPVIATTAAAVPEVAVTDAPPARASRPSMPAPAQPPAPAPVDARAAPAQVDAGDDDDARAAVLTPRAAIADALDRADALAQQRQPGRALALYQAADDQAQEHELPDLRPHAIVGMARAYLALGHPDRAAPLAQSAYELLLRSHRHAEAARAALLAGDALLAGGDAAWARAQITQAREAITGPEGDRLDAWLRAHPPTPPTPPTP